MNGYITYFDNGDKNMSFVTDDKKVYEKYNEIWEVIRKLLKVRLTVSPVRDDKYLVAKLNIFGKVNRTTYINDIIPLEIHSYNCISVIDIDSVLKIDNKRAYPQAYLEQCKYKLKKRKTVNFIDDEIIDDSDSDSDIDSSIAQIAQLIVSNIMYPEIKKVNYLKETEINNKGFGEMDL